MSDPVKVGQILEANFKTVQLSTTIKVGKEQITATVTDGTAEGAKALLEELKNLLGGKPAKPAEIKAPSKRESKKNAEIQARELNELALLWMRRVKAAIPHFRDMPDQQIAETLKCRTPMAMMNAEESGKLIELLQQSLTASAHNNPDVAAYLRIVQVIESLSSPEEWETRKSTDVDPNDWKLVQVNGSHLVAAAKSELDARLNLLSIAALPITVAAC